MAERPMEHFTVDGVNIFEVTDAKARQDVSNLKDDLTAVEFDVTDLKDGFDNTVTVEKSTNYFTGDWVDGLSLNADGTTTPNANRGVTEFMPIDDGTYFFHYANTQVLVNYVRVLMYDDSNNIIGSAINSNTFTTATGTTKIRLCAEHDYFNDRPMLSKSSATGSETYEEYFEPYLKSVLRETVNARTDSDGVTFSEFGERITKDESKIKEFGATKGDLSWELGNIEANSASPNYGKIMPSKYRIACAPVSFENDVLIDIDWSKYRIYIFGYADATGTSPRNIGWLAGCWIAPKNLNIGIIVAGLSDTTEYNTVYNEMYDSLTIKPINADVYRYGKNVKCINHRGYSRFIPEESALAYRLSAVAGYHGAETDVHFTADNIPVCTHNEIVVSDGTHINPTRYTVTEDYTIQVNVETSTYAQLDSYDWGFYAGTQYTGTKILKFEDYLKICRAFGMIPYIELKPSATISDGQLETLVAMVNACGLNRCAVWFGGNATYLQKIHTLLPNAKIGYVTGTITADHITTITSLRDDNEVFLVPANTGLTSEGVELCKNADVPIECWINGSYGNSEITAIQNVDEYITGVISNNVPAGMALQAMF